MTKVNITKEQLIEEGAELRQRVAQLEASEAELREASYALQVSETRYRRLFETAQDGILILDAKTGHINEVNTFLVEMLGYSHEDLLGKKLWQIGAFKDIEASKLAFEKLKENEYIRYEDLPLETRDGRRIEVEFVSNVYLVDSKKVIQCNIRDITKRRWLEQERKEVEVRAQIQSRLASVGEMASGIAHEINNPLTSVIGFSQLLLQKDIPQDIRHDVEIISDGAKRVASIINRLLTFSRQQKPERSHLDINEVMTTSLALQAYAMETSNIKVFTQLDPALPRTMADAGQMQQVFLNIIINAEKEMKLAHGKGTLWIRTEKADDAIIISFTDDGPGIPEENLQRIFEPFFTTRELGKGAGLGLSICHGIVAEHNGRTYAKSQVGKGATLIVELPIVQPAHLELAEERAIQARIKEMAIQARILVVDDEPTVLTLLEKVLSNEGYEVETVDNATDALDRIKGESYHLILLDIKMPGMSGIELYERIHHIDESLAKRIVFITGDVLGTYTRNFLSKTNAHYVTKPFDITQIITYLNNILAKGRLDTAKKDQVPWRLLKAKQGQKTKERTP
jgi:PAS domain S-box-containing protein